MKLRLLTIILTLIYTLNNMNAQSVYDFEVVNNKGEKVALSTYKGKLLLIVNTATACGFTPQYDDLEKLYEKYSAKGLEILDFPCNQFGGQAPGTDAEIQEFCSLKFGTKFPRFQKIEVNGEGAAPLYKYLKSQKSFAGFKDGHKIGEILKKMLSEADPDYASKPDIKWNFTKFLVDKTGKVVCRFEPTADFEEITAEVEKNL